MLVQITHWKDHNLLYIHLQFEKIHTHTKKKYDERGLIVVGKSSKTATIYSTKKRRVDPKAKALGLFVFTCDDKQYSKKKKKKGQKYITFSARTKSQSINHFVHSKKVVIKNLKDQ